MEKAYLSEAFRQLELLNEEDFNLSTTDGSEMKNFLDDDEDVSVMSLDVIDPEAESEEDLEDSYTGKVILDCCVCHSKLYKDKEEITIDEEQDLANTDEECPFCYSRDGFKIIGEVAPYGETEEETEIEDEEHEDMDEGFRTELIPNNGRKSFYGKAVVDTLDDGSQVLYSYNTPIIKKYPNGELKRLYDGWSATTGSHIKAFCGLDKKGFLNLEYEKFNESLKSRKNKSVNESEDGRKLFTEYKILVDGRTYEISHTKQRADEIVPILKDMYPDSEIEAKPYKHYASGIERKRLERQIADQLKEYGVNESVNESIQEIEIETDTDKIKIESEPKEESGEDVLAPVSPETENEIMSNGEDEVDIPLDDFDEETFDELGESFLKGTYENVKGYKTESVKEQDGNKLVVEGLITFNSGKVKKTSFIFEAKDITKSGKVRFIGENCQLSRGKKSFTVAGKIQEGKFISESLNYNYRAKDANTGKSTRMYGTVRTNK